MTSTTTTTMMVLCTELSDRQNANLFYTGSTVSISLAISCCGRLTPNIPMLR